MRLFEDLLVIVVLIFLPDFMCEKLRIYESGKVLMERRKRSKNYE